MIDIFERHANVALLLSGGKDSLACLYLYKPHWPDLMVYWCNTGDAFPETVAQMERVKKIVPHFKEVRGYQPEIHEADGWPSDVVPALHTSLGNVITGATPFKIQTRLDCCYHSLMLPTYHAIVTDGMTCCIRGKRHGEEDRTGLKSGDVTAEGVELIFPIYDWTSADVHAYLDREEVELPKFYAYGDHSHDCMHCTAWWGHGQSKYLKAEHPVVFEEYKRRITLIKQAVNEQLEMCEV